MSRNRSVAPEFGHWAASGSGLSLRHRNPRRRTRTGNRPVIAILPLLMVAAACVAALPSQTPGRSPPSPSPTFAWSESVIDETGATDPNPAAVIGPDGLPWILFSKGNGIRVAHPATPGSGCTNAAWRCETIVEVPAEGFGEGSDLALGPGSVPTAVFSRNSGGLYSMHFANRSAGGWWQRHPVANDFVPLALDFDATGRPVVAYQDTNGIGIGVARYVGSGGTGCGLATNWSCREVDPGTGLTGYGADILVDSTDVEHIVYSDFDAGILRYARSVGSGGNCGAGRYYCQSITSSMSNRPLSIARNSSGLLVTAQDGYGLALVRPDPSGGTGCAYAANWSCLPVSIADTASGKGSYSSLVVDGRDRPHIAFYSQENDSLEVASFEPGGASVPRCSDVAWHCHPVANAAGYSLSLAVDSADFLHATFWNYSGPTWSLGYATTVVSVPQSSASPAILAGVGTVAMVSVPIGLCRRWRP